MRSILILTLYLIFHLHLTYAATWYFLRYNTPSGSQSLSFSSIMLIPTLKKAGTCYLWLGLQPIDNSGVYQNVLDGQSETWWMVLLEPELVLGKRI